MGFKTVRQWVDAFDEGKTHIVSFRKAVSVVGTTMGDYIDYTYFMGSPVANFYASAPLEAALVEADKGIRVPDVPEQFVKSLTVMSVGSTATSAANQNQTLQLLDYLIYYPFIDMDAVGETQTMLPSVSLPRYTTGIKKTATNILLNTDFKLGTVAGSPGTAPTGWTISPGPTGVTRTIDFGTDQYGDYIQVRYVGTNTSGSTGYLQLRFDVASVSIGETFTLSADVALVDGAWPTAASCGFDDLNASTLYISGGLTSIKSAVTSSVPVTVCHSRTFSNPATAKYAAYPCSASCNTGETVDFTFRVYSPMLVKGIAPAPYVKSGATNGEVTWTSQGEGVRIMAISQSAATPASSGRFLFSYTNQDGIRRYTQVVITTKVVNGGGISLTYAMNMLSSFPFVTLLPGDTGVRSIDSVTFLGGYPGGGLMALVLVKPLMTIISGEECRTSTTGNIESFGSASQIESVIHRQPAKIEQGAVLGFIGCGNNGSLASSILMGVLETQWS